MAKKTVNKEPIETQLWKAADKLRKNIDVAEYKHVFLGLIFLKYISDAFEELHSKVFDPCCGSGGMFVQSEKFVTSHQGKINDISIC